MQRQRFGSLDAIVVGDSGPVCVLLHGWGAPGDDLVGVTEWIDAPGWRWVFPAAPMKSGPDDPAGRAWWKLDLDAFERSSADDRADEKPPGLPSARAQVRALLDAVAKAMPGAPIVLGGFSQGAMLALDVALHDPRPLAGLILMSGTLINAAEWTPRMAARAGLPVLQSHGRSDPLLSFRAAEALRDLMLEGGLDVAWVPFRGGHELGPAADAIRAFLVATARDLARAK
jgi:phospholipase/carboxylesterase